MNRTLLIVICDFLLLTLIASVRLDRPPTLNLDADEGIERAATLPAAGTSPRTSDLVDTMKASLEDERVSREKLASALSETEKALRARQAELEQTHGTLLSKEEEARRIEQARNALAGQFQDTQQTLQRIQQELAATAAEARLSQQRLSSVEQQYALAQTNLVQMERQLSSSSTEARLARERLAQIEADLRSRQAAADEARARIEQVDRLREAAELERERIAGQLKVAETEQKFTREQLQNAQGQIQTVQQEKAELQKVATELAEGVVQFAEKQGELAQEIREHRPVAANSIFADFITNRVSTDFRADRSGVLGRRISKDSQTRTILVTDGLQTYALYHVEDTPFSIGEFGRDWERFIVHLYRASTILPLSRILFLSIDPRIVVAPVTETQAKQLGARVYKVVTDPYRFQDAVIIGADEGYYGETRFTLDARNPGYLRMDRSMLGKLVGRFNPSRGDLVFSKSGDLIGIMVNKQYCAMLTSFVPSATIPTGANLDADSIGARLSHLNRELRQLPEDLQ